MLVSGSRRQAVGVAMATAVALLTIASTASAAKFKTLETYGTPGDDGPGGVSYVQGIGVDPVSGKVVIPDGWNRISVYSPKGMFLRAFGTDVVPGGGTGPEVCKEECQEGDDSQDGAGDQGSILDTEVSPDGRIYASDESNSRISVYTMKGKFLFAFGDDVNPAGLDGPEVCKATCQEGDNGFFGGSFAQPWAMAFGPDGDLYITNTDNNRVDRYKPDGEHLFGFGRDVNVEAGTGFETCRTDVCQVGDNGGGPSSLPRPEGVDFDPDGNIWVGSWNGTRLNAFSRGLNFLRGIGTDVIPGGGTDYEVCVASCKNGIDGSGDGELASAQGVAVEAGKGTAYVADSDNNRINAYRSDGSFVRSIGYGVGGGTELGACSSGCGVGVVEGAFNEPYPLHVDCRGTIYVGSVQDGTTQAIGSGKAKPGPCKLKVRKLKLKNNGYGKLEVLVPYAGKVSVKGKGVKGDKTTHEGLEGTEKLQFETKPSADGRITLKVAMKPSDGNVKQTAKAKLNVPG